MIVIHVYGPPGRVKNAVARTIRNKLREIGEFPIENDVPGPLHDKEYMGMASEGIKIVILESSKLGRLGKKSVRE